MHNCLKIVEIVDAIYIYLDPSQTSIFAPGPKSSFRDLAVMARTCTTFNGPALDHLWRSTTLDKLLTRCMPSDLWTFEKIGDSSGKNKLKLLRPIRAPDWDRLRLYAPRVRHLSSYGPILASGDALDALSVSLPEKLFQNLKSLTWHRIAEFHYINLFLSPALTRLDITLTSFSTVSLLSSLASVCPRLTHVSIESDSSPYTEDISKFVCAIQRPEKLTLPSLTWKAVAYLSRLGTLKSLDLKILPRGLQRSSVQGTNAFSALRTLSFEESDIRPVTDFLRLCTAVPLKEFDSDSYEFATAADMHALFIAIAAGFSHASLEQLVLNNDCEEFEGADPTDHLIPHHSLLPLLCFTNLTMLCITSPMGFDLDDGAVSDFARALPHVMTFSLTARFPTQIPRTTLACLHSFAQYCPRLVGLTIALDATTVPTIDLNQSQAGGVLHPALRRLYVQHSPVGRAMSVARFISFVFPRLNAIQTHREYEANDENDEEDMLDHGEAIRHHNRWKEVEGLLLEVSAIREEGRMLGVQLGVGCA
ncbi:hypothetical protein B0H16DRAFT_1612348 [Mycena metata]|uniref:F-box domain-containing protein n=1 Tax=Mycena metata TaxID=1033252 RepID=A0AAD7HCC9_9AGAR|nr:hypothetical protein B0H16DRAFT_1612348 [Mycena metata]